MPTAARCRARGIHVAFDATDRGISGREYGRLAQLETPIDFDAFRGINAEAHCRAIDVLAPFHAGPRASQSARHSTVTLAVLPRASSELGGKMPPLFSQLATGFGETVPNTLPTLTPTVTCFKPVKRRP